MDVDSADGSSPPEITVNAPDTPTPGAGEGGLLKALDSARGSEQPKPALRPDQIANAVSFLTNPKVVVRCHIILLMQCLC